MWAENPTCKTWHQTEAAFYTREGKLTHFEWRKWLSLAEKRQGLRVAVPHILELWSCTYRYLLGILAAFAMAVTKWWTRMTCLWEKIYPYISRGDSPPWWGDKSQKQLVTSPLQTGSREWTEREVGLSNLKTHPQWPTSSKEALPPKHFVSFTNSGIIWGPSVPTHEPIGDISHSKHSAHHRCSLISNKWILPSS